MKLLKHNTTTMKTKKLILTPKESEINIKDVEIYNQIIILRDKKIVGFIKHKSLGWCVFSENMMNKNFDDLEAELKIMDDDLEFHVF